MTPTAPSTLIHPKLNHAKPLARAASAPGPGSGRSRELAAPAVARSAALMASGRRPALSASEQGRVRL